MNKRLQRPIPAGPEHVMMQENSPVAAGRPEHSRFARMDRGWMTAIVRSPRPILPAVTEFVIIDDHWLIGAFRGQRRCLRFSSLERVVGADRDLMPVPMSMNCAPRNIDPG